MIDSNDKNPIEPAQKACRILAVTLGGLGDAVLFSPNLKALRRKYPDAEIEMLLSSRLAESAYRECKEIDSIQVLNTKQECKFGNALEIINYAFQSRKNGGFDIAVFATGLNPIISMLLKYAGNIRSTYKAPGFNPAVKDLSSNVKLAEKFDTDICQKDVFIPFTEESKNEAERVLKSHHIFLSDIRLIAVYPSKGFWHRPRWELAKLIEVIRVIKSHGLKARFVVVGSAEEGKDWEKVDKDRIVDANLAGKLSILGAASILKECSLSICNDGGIMHVAGAVNCPLVAIMPNTPYSYHPPGDKTTIIHSSLSCAINCYPNRPKNCTITKCTDEISSDRVAQACLRLLA